jgi:hypothetical protein
MMLSCSILHSLAHNERIWDSAYKHVMPDTHAALHLAPNPDYWRFRNSSSSKFLFEFKKASTQLSQSSPTFEVDVVMNVMKEFSHSPLIQKAAVYVLRRLAYYPQVIEQKYREKIEQFRTALGQQGAVESCVKVLLRFDDPELLGGALCAIGNLVIDGENAQVLLDVKGVEVIVEAMKKHLSSFTVIDYACFALCNLGDEYKFKDAIWKSGAPDVALDVLQGQHWKPEELTPAIDLLAVLCQVMEVKIDYGKRIIDTVNKLIETPHPKLMAHLLTLAVLACENVEQNRDYAVSLAFVEKMFGVLASFADEALIFSKATLVLFTLFWRNDAQEIPENRIRLVHSIVSAMSKFKHDLSLQRTSAAMLSDFAHSDASLKRLIVSLGGKELVRFALNISPSSDAEADPEWHALAAFISIDD